MSQYGDAGNGQEDWRQLYANVQMASDDLIFLFDPDADAVTFDAEKLFRLHHVQMMGNTVNDFFNISIALLHPEDLNRFIDDFSFLRGDGVQARQEQWSGDYRYRFADDRYFWCRCTVFPGMRFKRTNRGVLLHIKDIDRSKAREAYSRILAQQDILTGAYNIESFQINAKRFLSQQSAKGVLLYFQIKGFDAMAQKRGSRYGEELLMRFSHLLKSFVRVNDYVGRHGGNDFVVLITGARSRQTLAVSLEELNESFQVALRGDLSDDVELLVGCAFVPEDASGYDQLLLRAKGQAAPIAHAAHQYVG